MSVLQEYADIRKEIGEEKFSHIEMFLDNHPHYLLSDVYYRESVWKEFETWETAEELAVNKKESLDDKIQSASDRTENPKTGKEKDEPLAF